MYNPGVSELEHVPHTSRFQRYVLKARTYVTTANSIGLLGALCALFCLIALPSSQYWNIRLPLYLLLVILTILRPRVALYLLPIAVPWGALDTISLGGLNLNSADILVFLLAASWLMSFALRPFAAGEVSQSGPLDRDSLNIPRYLVLAMLALLLAMLLSMTVTLSLTSSIKELSKWIEFLIVLVIGAQYIRTSRQIWALIIIICLAAISQACMGYAQNFFSLGPTTFVRDAGLRVYGTFGQPNPYAGYINMTLTIAIALTLLSKSWNIRILAGVTTFLLAAAEYLSQSRGGEISIAIALIFIVAIGMPRLQPLVRLGIIGALGVVAAYLAGLLPEHYLAPVLRTLGLTNISFSAPSSADFSTAERLAHWIAGVRMFITHPILGVGIGNYPDYYPQYFVTIFINPLGHAHNYYINIAAEAGLLGLITFLAFLLANFVAGGRSYRKINTHWQQLKARLAHPVSAISSTEARKLSAQLTMLTNRRALAIGLLASLLSICVHNMVDNLYVHSMTSLIALLLVILIRVEAVTTETK
ncbi:hypothetical protein EPA93_20710 [Ktedonosporobacter rubrisoli]|uniref:O-antigen ligase-related domain-containing protein n=1 Tax=Ktedonosporobacter rubrisoli TaxID=2509675 RepID=A0A4P6JS04_KTERU|nr:O-antigen ligase family protein [Ktedonosporobacter rubrisoli]QBD78288.1 hypothetical protein EPA93_20710 [Ktedonosporobacter rubrisoli]